MWDVMGELGPDGPGVQALRDCRGMLCVLAAVTMAVTAILRSAARTG